MKCSNCGEECQNNILFCTNCGAKIEAIEDNQIISKAPVKKKVAIIATSIVILCMLIVGFLYLFLNENAIPRTYEEAKNHFNKELETAKNNVVGKNYENLFTTLDDMEANIDKVMESEMTDKPYPKAVIDLSLEASNKIKEIKINNMMDVINPLYADKKYKELTRFFEKDMMNDEEHKDKVLDIFAISFSKVEDFKNTEMILREMLNPFSTEALEKTLKFKKYLDKNYPDRERTWVRLGTDEFSKPMRFIDGMAKVAINTSTDKEIKNYKWGIIDKEGGKVVKIEYDTIGMFLEGLAAVQKDGKWGFIDETGKIVIPIEYDNLKETQDYDFFRYVKRDPEMVDRGFYEGFAPVKKNGKWGFIDKKGKPLGRGFIYDDVLYFNEGYGVVKIGRNFGLIDASGNYVIQPGNENEYGDVYEAVRPIYEGLSAVNWDNRKYRGIINKKGRLLELYDDESFDLVQDYREGLASIRKIDYNNSAKWGFLSRDGDIEISTQYDSVTVFIDGISQVSINNKFGLINRNDESILPVTFDYIGAFSEDYAIIKKDGLFGFVDKSGHIIVSPQYTKVTNFFNGVAGVEKDGKWGVIDTDGSMILAPTFESMKEYNNGVAPAKIGGKWGYVDITGFFVVEPIFEEAHAFYEGYASVKEAGTGFYYIKLAESLVNLDGKILDDEDYAVEKAKIKIYKADDLRNADPIFETISNGAGMFKAVLPSGKYRIVVSRDGYVTAYSYDVVESMESNYATSINLVFGKATEKAQSIVMVGNALTGDGLKSAEVRFRYGFNNSEGEYICGKDGKAIVVSTDGNGEFSVELPLGVYTAEVQLKGYTTTHINFISSKTRKMSVKNQAMTEILSEGEIRITLEWGENPSDLDSHLVGPISGKYEKFHVFYPLKGEIIGNSMLDKDDIEGNGFETTTIYQQDKEGVYKYSVFDFSNGSDYESHAMSLSGARVRVYQGDSCIATYDVPTNKSGNLWEVFELDGTKIKGINNVTNHHDYSFYTY